MLFHATGEQLHLLKASRWKKSRFLQSHIWFFISLCTNTSTLHSQKHLKETCSLSAPHVMVPVFCNVFVVFCGPRFICWFCCVSFSPLCFSHIVFIVILQVSLLIICVLVLLICFRFRVRFLVGFLFVCYFLLLVLSHLCHCLPCPHCFHLRLIASTCVSFHFLCLNKNGQ